MKIFPIIQNFNINVKPYMGQKKFLTSSFGAASDVFVKRDSEYAFKDLAKVELEFLNKNKNLTLENDVDLFKGIKEREFDINKLMAIAAENSIRRNGNAYIFDNETPPIFEGLDKIKLADDITKQLSTGHMPSRINLAGKNFNVRIVDGGDVGVVYKLIDEKGNMAALKHFTNFSKCYNNGRVEIACSRQMTKDKVVDVPKFYMANAANYTFNSNNEVINTPMWMAMEFITRGHKVKEGGPSWKTWLGERNLKDIDAEGKNIKGKYLVDIGGIYHDMNKKFDFQASKRAYNILCSILEKGKGIKGVKEYYQKQL